LLLAPLLAACTVAGYRTAEEPGFESLGHVGEVELRRYSPRLLAEIEMGGDEEAARNAGFRPLAAYIFGANAERERIGMTAPVAQQGAADRWRVGFFMPSRYERQNLPTPQDSRITLRPLPGSTVAVLRFSGMPRPEALAEARARLLAALRASPWQVTGEGGAWFYDPPWTLPMARRNEVWVPVRAEAAASQGNRRFPPGA
jgi:hypothetical protein